MDNLYLTSLELPRVLKYKLVTPYLISIWWLDNWWQLRPDERPQQRSDDSGYKWWRSQISLGTTNISKYNPPFVKNISYLGAHRLLNNFHWDTKIGSEIPPMGFMKKYFKSS